LRVKVESWTAIVDASRIANPHDSCPYAGSTAEFVAEPPCRCS
jgi:hypothetical protein